MEDTLSKLLAAASDPYECVAEWKQRTGKKVIGCFPMHIPEELIHATGMLPVQLWRGNELISLAHGYMRPVCCGLVRSSFDDLMMGKLSFLDGMVFTTTCLQVRTLPSIIERNYQPGFPYLRSFYLPMVLNGHINKEIYIAEIKKFKASLEEFSGQEATTETINQSISIYNKNRGLLRRIYELRAKSPRLLKAKEMVAIVQASMLMPKEEHSALLESLLADLEKRATTDEDGAVRLFLSGHLCHAPRVDVLDLIEDAGGVIVGDDLFTGFRYFANDVQVTENPLEAIADQYFKNRPPSPTVVDLTSNWGDYIVDAANASKAQGVINLIVKFCPPHMEHYPRVKGRLEAGGLPSIVFELEHEAVSLEGIKTRVNAFIETIRSK